MAIEREPPKSPAKPDQQPTSTGQRPEFGRTSHLQSPLRAAAGIFNIPKANRPRPEHHREAPRSTSDTFEDLFDPKSKSSSNAPNTFLKPASGSSQNPYVLNSVENSPDVVQI